MESQQKLGLLGVLNLIKIKKKRTRFVHLVENNKLVVQRTSSWTLINLKICLKHHFYH